MQLARAYVRHSDDVRPGRLQHGSCHYRLFRHLRRQRRRWPKLRNVTADPILEGSLDQSMRKRI